MCTHVRNQKISEKNPLHCRFTSGSKDIKSSLRGAKLPNGQPMLLDEEQNSLALLIEQVEEAGEYNGRQYNNVYLRLDMS